MVTMQNQSVSPKKPIKGELLCKLANRFPSIDLSTVELVSHIQAISKNLSLLINQDLAEHGLTEGKMYVLAFLFSEELMGRQQPGPSQIADHIGVTRGTVTGLLDGLERDGFLERFHDIHDRRALTIKITDKARTFLDRFMPNVAAMLENVIPLDEQERRETIALLGQIEVALARIAPIQSDC